MRQRDGAVLVGDLGLDAAPAAAVAREHDLALDVDLHLLEALVVGGHAVVDVDDLAGGVAVGRVGVEDRGRVGVGRVRILRQRRLLDGERDARRRHHLDQPLGRPGHEGLEALDTRVESPGFELLQRVVGDALRTRPPGHMRLARHRRHVLLQPGAVGHFLEVRLPLALRGDGVGRKPAEGGRLGPRAGSRCKNERKEGDDEGERARHGLHLMRTCPGPRAVGRPGHCLKPVRPGRPTETHQATL